jgi:signal transduction histidine kinase
MFAAFVGFYIITMHEVHDITKEALSELREDFRRYFGTTVTVVVAFSGLVGWFMARRALTSVGEVTRAATLISKGELDSRVPVKGRNDDLDLLAEAFNTMAEQIQTLISEMKEMTDSIAHDIRSAITRMRGTAELTLLGDATKDEYQAVISSIVEQCDHLLAMTNTMLEISRAEAGLTELKLESVDLVVMMGDMVELFEPAAEDRNISITLQAPRELTILGDVQKLQRVFANLIDNAVKYTSEEGVITILLEEGGHRAFVTIEDTGMGIAEADLPHIFDRFFRGERSRSASGSGLGLSLAKVFVTAHGGTITVESKPGQGSRFVIALPKNPGPHITKR